MRYFDLKLFAPQSGTQPARVVQEWTSYPGGAPDPGYPLIECDAPVSVAGAPANSGATITVHGVPLTMLQQAANFTPDWSNPAAAQFYTMQLSGGMGGGLPLENPKQIGTLLEGAVVQSFGNWVGTEQSISFVVAPGGPFDDEHPGPFVLNWPPGTPLGAALKQTLSTVYGASNVSINLLPVWSLPYAVKHVAATLGELAGVIREHTKANTQLGPVFIVASKGKVRVFDQAGVGPTVVQVNFQDMLGQPTWIDSDTLSIQLVLRGDIDIGTVLQLPASARGGPGSVTVAPSQTPISIKEQSTFTQQWTVFALRYILNSRSADAAEWSVVARCYPYQPAALPPALRGPLVA